MNMCIFASLYIFLNKIYMHRNHTIPHLFFYYIISYFITENWLKLMPFYTNGPSESNSQKIQSTKTMEI
jgi:hypothetical protein